MFLPLRGYKQRNLESFCASKIITLRFYIPEIGKIFDPGLQSFKKKTVAWGRSSVCASDFQQQLLH